MTRPKTAKSSPKSKANGHGGRRPGAGRPKKLTQEHQQHVRDLFISMGDEARMRSVIERIYALAEQGEQWACNVVLQWQMGKVPDETKLTGEITHGVIFLPARKEIER